MDRTSLTVSNDASFDYSPGWAQQRRHSPNIVHLRNDGLELVELTPAEQLERGLHPLELEGSVRVLDHVVQVVPHPRRVDELVDEFARHGAVVVEAPVDFPDTSCPGVAADPRIAKRMATVALSSGLLVISSPRGPGDQLDGHLRRFGPSVPHHIAVLVENVELALKEWVSAGYEAGPVVGDDMLTQVFLASPSREIVELVARLDGTRHTFTCTNVAALSLAEERLRDGGAS